MIKFYDPRNPWGFFSNFSRHRVRIYDRDWPTSEHAFQAMKFHPHRPDLVKAVHETAKPHEAAAMGRDRSLPLRPDWNAPAGKLALALPDVGKVQAPFAKVDDSRGPAFIVELVKDVFMFEIVLFKFEQHEDLGKALLSTGDQPIIEDAIHDPYWGWGSSMTGVNRLGKILMGVRTILAG